MDEDSDHRSELGLKEFWDTHYHEEISNFDEHGDVGEIWFGRGITAKIVAWIQQKYADRDGTRIVDIGCGNGFMLTSLLKVGFKRLTGLDYSHDAIVLSKKIASSLDNGSLISYHQEDILKDESEDNSSIEKFEVIIDKGTFDAICLNPTVTDIQSLVQKYVCYISKRMHTSSHFIICSCNWTQEELCNYFHKFKLLEEIPSASIQFGGQTGNRVTCLVFTRDDIE